MTSQERELHARMNSAVLSALINLAGEFDITPADKKPDAAAWQGLVADIKALLLAAYTRNHNI